MTDVLWPPDIAPSSQRWSVLGNAGVFQSPLNGAVRTVSRSGARWACTVSVPPLKGQNRARLMAVLGSLRDRSNRIWMPDFSNTARSTTWSVPELLTNNDFSNGTTGISAGTDSTVDVTDRVLRVTRSGITAGGAYAQLTSTTQVQYAPYVLRAMIASISGSENPGVSGSTNTSAIGSSAYDVSTSQGLRKVALLATATTAPNLYLENLAPTLYATGNYFDVSWCSYSSCTLADNGPNALLQSDDFNTTWTKSKATVSVNSTTAPDGSSTADSLVEDSTTGNHTVSQAITVSSAAADYTFCIAVKAAGRSFVELLMQEGTGPSNVYQSYNLGTGSVGAAGATGSNWANRRSTMHSVGGGWYILSLTARKTNAATSITAYVFAESADGTDSYLGNGAAALYLWRATAAQSSVPVRLTQTTSAATTGTSQTGRSLYLKGLPASTSGIRLSGDPVQIGNQINFLAASLDSDAAGRGLMTCMIPWRTSPSDNDPVFFNTPMAKMMLADDSVGWDTGPGQFSGFDLNLVEDVT